jgi:hypothetical protein
VSTISPDTSSCVIQPTSDQQLNYNLAEMVKMLIASLQDGTIAVKNSERIQKENELHFQDFLFFFLNWYLLEFHDFKWCVDYFVKNKKYLR